MNMNVERHRSRDRPKKRWMDYMKDDMRINGVSMEMTSYKNK
jgi:Uri superfamily endonuclease